MKKHLHLEVVSYHLGVVLCKGLGVELQHSL